MNEFWLWNKVFLFSSDFKYRVSEWQIEKNANWNEHISEDEKTRTFSSSNCTQEEKRTSKSKVFFTDN